MDQRERRTAPAAAARNQHSIRGRLHRAFAMMLIMVVVVGTVTLVTLPKLTNSFRTAASELSHEANLVSDLRARITELHDLAHKIQANAPLDRVAFVVQQQQIDDLFGATVLALTQPDARAAMVSAHQAWRVTFKDLGLWDEAVFATHGNTGEEHYELASRMTGIADDLTKVDTAIRLDVEKALDKDEALGHRVMVVVAGAIVLSLVMTLYLARRVSHDVLRPVRSLHDGVAMLQSGDLDHRVSVQRRDEFGALAAAFNTMADALDATHHRLTHQARHDPLTRLFNRGAFRETLDRIVRSGDRHSQHASLLFVDIDDFKNVNDTLGHGAGDQLLTQVGNRLRTSVRPADTVARLGGDEFAIVVVDVSSDAQIAELAQRVVYSFHEPFAIDGHNVQIGASVGVAVHTPAVTADELLQQADFAMYMAKGQGKGCFAFFDATMHDRMTAKATLKAELSRATAADQLRLHYQPVVDLKTGRVIGVEALVRWQHPVQGLLPPGEFIPLAEETGEITNIGRWVLVTAARQVMQWRRQFADHHDLWVSVNVSPRQLRDESHLRDLAAPFVVGDLDPTAVVIEITETAVVDDLVAGNGALDMFKAVGIRLAIDDFGTGFSSLSSLQRLPIDVLKIDRSFVSGDNDHTPATALIEAVVGLGTRLGLDIIAEGIEETEQLEVVRSTGCHAGQGYHIARPVTPEAITQLFTHPKSLVLAAESLS